MNAQILDFYSLCMVNLDSEEHYVLWRLADVEHGKLVHIDVAYDKPFSIENITNTRQFTGDKIVGKLGIWRFICTPRTTKPDIYVIRAYFQSDLRPIQTCRWYNQTSESANKILHSGFSIPDGFDKTSSMMCLYHYANGFFSGILCSSPTWISVGAGFADKSKIKLSATTKSEIIENILPDEIFTVTETAYTPKLSFIDTVTGGIFNESQAQADISEYIDPRIQRIISTHIKELATWNTFKKLDVNKRSVQLFWEFLSNLDRGTLYDKISASCNCTYQLAEKHVDLFIENAVAYFDGTDIDTEILERLVQQNSALKEQCIDLAEIDWKKENYEQVHAAEALLSELESQLLSQKADLSQLLAEEKTLKNKLNTLHAEIADAETKRGQQTALADDATTRIQQKILTARRDVAEFISDISLYMPATTSVDIHPVKPITYDNLIMDTSSVSECEIVDSVDSLISWIDKNLIDAGVDERKSEALAKYLFACKQAGISLILAGPGGEAVAKAFSCATTGKYPVQLICDGDWNQYAVDELIQTSSDIVIVKNPFNAKWIDRLPEVMFNANKIFLLLTPFKDDLVVEPADLYQYALPLFTSEWIVDSATNDYVCAKLDTAVSNKDWSQREYDISELITHPTGLMNRRIQSALGIFRTLQSTEFKHYMEMYCIKPLLTALGKTRE